MLTMEHKIGEIFEYNGEWYQCIRSSDCPKCDLKIIDCRLKFPCESLRRKDCEEVIFKKLEKVGDPYVAYGKVRQQYKLHAPLTITNGIIGKDMSCDDVNLIVDIELKQNKEDMEDLDKIKVRDYTKVEELNVMEEKKLNLKPFDLQKAREGKPVCTRDGRKARIICFDVKAKKPIAALITNDDTEEAHFYYDNGRSDQYLEYRYDLMILPEKKEGWVNIVRGSNGSPHMGRGIFQSKEEAENAIKAFSDNLIDTVKISWEE